MTYILGIVKNNTSYIVGDSVITSTVSEKENLKKIHIQQGSSSFGEKTIISEYSVIQELTKKIYIISDEIIIAFAGNAKEAYDVIDNIKESPLLLEKPIECVDYFTKHNPSIQLLLSIKNENKPIELYNYNVQNKNRTQKSNEGEYIHLGSLNDELKTKKVDSQTLNLTLTYFKRDDVDKKTEPLKNPELEKTRNGRQILGMANLLFNEKGENDLKKKLTNPTYSKEVEKLLLSSKTNQSKYIQVSEGLAFISLKSRKTSLHNNIFHKDFTKYGVNDDFKDIYVEVAKKLIKKDSENNGIIIGQLLYNPDLTDKNTPGTVPLFWHPINSKVLKQMYFLNTIVISLFNPIHLIEEIEKLGYFVDSKYSNKKREDVKPTRGIDRFDLFISYIINFLMTESFVLESVKHIENEYGNSMNGGNAQILIKPQQKFNIIPAANNVYKTLGIK